MHGRNSRTRVLLLGTVLTLTARVARCLELAGLAPIILGTEDLRVLSLLPECLAFFAWEGLTWENGAIAGDLTLVKRLCRVHSIDVVVAADYDTTVFLAKHGDGLKPVRVGPVPEPALMEQIHNKWRLAQRMASLGVPHPASFLAIDHAHLGAHGLSYPIITKPLAASDSVGLRVFEDAAALEAAIDAGTLFSWPLLVQEYVRGDDVDMSFVAVDGRIVAHSIFKHQPHGRDFVEAPKLRRSIEAIVASCKYSGVGHADSRYDPSRDEYFVLEINPRFWGSLLYERQAGLNYAEIYVNLALGRHVPVETRTPARSVHLSLRDTFVMGMLGRVQKMYSVKYWLSSRLPGSKNPATKAGVR